MNNLVNASLTAAALAGMFSSVAMADDHAADKKTHGKASADAKGAKVRCFGINSCKGKSECSVKDVSDCGGKNECKGKGWVSLAMKDCNEQHGKVLEGKPEHHK